MKSKNNKCLHICSLNCQGLGNFDKVGRVKTWMSQQKCDILFIQETHFVKENKHKIDQILENHCFHNFGSSNSRGVSIMIKKNHNFSIIDQYEDTEGRILILNIDLENKIYTLVNIYAPNKVSERNSFFQKI